MTSSEQQTGTGPPDEPLPARAQPADGDVHERARRAAEQSAEVRAERRAVGAQHRHAVRRAQRALDRAAEESELTLGWRWADAFNRRDAAGLVALSAPGIEVHPTLFAGEPMRYDGHDGLRRWVADVVADGSPERMRVVDVRHERAGVILIVGQIELVWATTPLSTVLTIDDAVVQVARSWFSDEQTIRAAGHLD